MVYRKNDNRANIHPKKKEYYPKLKNLIATLGPRGVNINQLEREWGIPDSTLHNWRLEALKELGPLKAIEIGENSVHNLDWHCRRLHNEIVKCTDVKTLTVMIKVYSEVAERLMRLQEGYGFKQAVIPVSNDDKVLLESISVFGKELEVKHEERKVEVQVDNEKGDSL